MDELSHLSLVSKVAQELDNHLGVSDKVLAEFIIDLADKNSKAARFHEVLEENGAAVPLSFATNLLSIIQRMRPPKGGKAGAKAKGAKAELRTNQPDGAFPGLAVINQVRPPQPSPRAAALAAAAARVCGECWVKVWAVVANPRGGADRLRRKKRTTRTSARWSSRPSGSAGGRRATSPSVSLAGGTTVAGAGGRTTGGATAATAVTTAATAVTAAAAAAATTTMAAARARARAAGTRG